MKTLQRYILREYLIPFFYCLTGFLSIYILFESFGSFGRLMDAKPSIGVILHYFAGYVSPYFEWLAPAALMLAALYTMWNFCRHSELIAMRANGISFGAIACPILFVAALMTAFVYWVNNVYVPKNAQWAQMLKSERFQIEKMAAADNLIYHNARTDRTWTIDGIDEDAQHLTSVRVTIDRDGGGRLMTVTAPKADYLDGEWWFTDAKVQHYDAAGSEVVSPTPDLDSLTFRAFPQFREKPRDFLMQNRKWEHYSLRDRLRFVRTNTDLSAHDRRKCIYDIWQKALSPLACLVIVLFAIPAGVTSGRQSVFRGILMALAMFFGFYALVIFGMVLAEYPWCPACVAAAFPYILFLILGIRAFRRLG